MNTLLALFLAAAGVAAHAETGHYDAGSHCENNGATTASERLICANGQWRQQRTDAPYAATSGDDTLYTLIAR